MMESLGVFGLAAVYAAVLLYAVVMFMLPFYVRRIMQQSEQMVAELQAARGELAANRKQLAAVQTELEKGTDLVEQAGNAILDQLGELRSSQ